MLQFSPTIKRRLSAWTSLPGMPTLLSWAAAVVVPRHRVGALVVLRDDTGQVLLLEHVFHPECPWGLPGGWLRRGETPQQAAVRELAEETGLRCRLGSVLMITREIRPSHLTVVFSAHLAEGELRVGREIVSARWFDPEELPADLEDFVHRAVGLAITDSEAGSFAGSVE